MARIIFVDKNDYKDKLGIYYLAAVLKQAGHKVEYCETGCDDIHRYFKKKVDFVFYSVMSCEYAWFKSFNRRLKKTYVFRTVAGGAHFTVCPEDGTRDPDVDFVVQGPGEMVVTGIVNGSITDRLVKGIIPDINALPRPDRSIVYKYARFKNAHLKRFIACRECPYHCSYCHNHIFHKVFAEQRQRFFQRLHPERLIEDVLDVQKRYGIGIAVFNDDDFAADVKWLHSFCKTWIKRKVNIPFACFLNAHNVSRDSIRLLAKAGLHLASIGIESSSPLTRKKILGRIPVSNERIAQTIRTCMDHGIKVKALNMIGMPVPDPMRDALDTILFNQKINPTNSSCCIIVPFPRTRLYEYCRRHGYLKSNFRYVDMREKTILELNDARKINRLCKWWNIFVTKQIPLEWINLILEVPLPGDLEKKMLALSNKNISALYEIKQQ